MEKTVKLFKGVTYGDFIECTNCGERMVVPVGVDTCPFCHASGCNMWADEEHQEVDVNDIEREHSCEYVEEDYFGEKDYLASIGIYDIL